MILHLDMDAFFASIEQRDHPEYQGKPVVVGAMPGKRGVVSTCSYEARRFGIHSAMPISDAHRRCPDAIYLTPDMSRYVLASKQVMTILGQISPVVEPVSIDEAYLDITGLERLYGSPEQIGMLTKRKIQEVTRLNCSVGIGPNRLIAKLASDYQKPDGMTLVRPEEVESFLDPMAVSNLRGVGKQTLKIIHRLGIKTVGELRGYPLEILQHYFGKHGGQHLHDQARGLASDRVGERAARKSISKETTFNKDVSDPRMLREKLRSLSSQVGRIARREGVRGLVVTLKIRLSSFETHTRQYRLEQAVDTDTPIFQTAWRLYSSSEFINKPIRLIGVGITRWDAGQPVADLFEDTDKKNREKRLYATMDRVVEKFGEDKLSFGFNRNRPRED